MVQAVILAAGKSTRMYPLTLTRPKPLLPVLNRTIIERTLEQIYSLVSEIIIVVGYKKEMILDHLGASYRGVPLRYVIQKEQLGTGHALMLVRPYLKGRFVVINGDDLYHKDDIRSLLSHKYALLVNEVEDPRIYGVIVTDGDRVRKLVEKPKRPPSDLANTGVYALDLAIFDLDLKKTSRDEYEIVDYINYLIKHSEVNYHTVKHYWLPIGYPWQLLNAHEFFIEHIKRSAIRGKIEPKVSIKGNVIVESGAVVRSGTYIEGPAIIGKNCIVGPNTYIRKGTVLGAGSKVGNGCEIKNSILFEHVKVGHLSYVGDSILAEDVSLGAGTITANLRHDGKGVKSAVKGNLVDSGRRKFGAILGAGVHTGIHTSIYPGRKMWPGTSTLPSQTVKYDMME